METDRREFLKGTAWMGAVTVAACIGLSGAVRAADVEIACRDFTLRVGEDACVKSLLVQATGEECVDAALRLPLFTVTQDRPFNNEVKLIHPNKRTVYPACSLRRAGDTLVVGFPHRQYEAKVSVKTADGYVAFMLEDFICDRKSTYDYLKMDIPPVASFRVLQLPVKNRKNFGDWLNASWDEKAAVGVVGTSPYPDIDHEERVGAKILFGEVYAGIKLRGASAALIAAPGRDGFARTRLRHAAWRRKPPRQRRQGIHIPSFGNSDA